MQLDFGDLALLGLHRKHDVRFQGPGKIFAETVDFFLRVIFQRVGGLGMTKGHGNFDLAHGTIDPSVFYFRKNG
jgi:hypothetical protein